LFAAGFVFSYLILNRYFKQVGLKEEYLDKLTVYMVVATIIGARLGHVFFYDWDYYHDHLAEIILPFRFEPEFQFTGFQGLASHGGIFAVFIALYLYSRKHKIRFLWILDMLSLVGPLAGACIRLGNLMNSEIIGEPATVPWAFIFERVDQIPRHPGQLYEALAYLMIFFLLNWLYRHRNFENGFLFGLFFVLLFGFRFLIEFTKADQVDFEAGMALNMGQILSIPFIVGGLIIMIMKRKTTEQKKGPFKEK
jgi:prolipoprotein diacylglyceryl transferase